jgi:hypothetical protein
MNSVRKTTNRRAPIVFLVISLIGCYQAANAGDTAGALRAAFGSDLRVFGPVERISLPTNAVIVAGQIVSVDRSTALDFAEGSVGSALSNLKVGELVAVSGPIDGAAKKIFATGKLAVNGATDVFIRGVVGGANLGVGHIRIGELDVDITPVLFDPENSILDIGQVVEVVGIQPNFNGTVVVSSFARSIIGTSKSIIGTSKSIIGTSKSIIGTSKSIIGTSKSIIGTSKSIIGTSKSIIGTSKSIIGTSKSIIGTS